MKKKVKKYRQGIFAVVYTVNKKKIEYLLLKRKKHWIGWEFVKGGIEEGETMTQTTKREVEEETGQKVLMIRDYNKFGKYLYDKKTILDRKCDGQTYSLFSAEVKRGKVTIDKKEHSGYKWVNIKEAIKLLTWPSQKEAIKVVDKRNSKFI